MDKPPKFKTEFQRRKWELVDKYDAPKYRPSMKLSKAMTKEAIEMNEKIRVLDEMYLCMA